MSLKHEKHKVNVSNAKCAKREHTFIVSGWLKSTSKDIAMTFTCSTCLLTLQKNEFETVRDHLDCCAVEKYAAEVSSGGGEA